jgi:protein-serine/threonine kinase
MTPPFVPNIKSTDDTHYFDEEDSISDFSASASQAQPTTEEVADALKKFNRELQILATGFIERPYDSIRLRKVDKEIDAVNVSDEQKNYLKEFVKRYGRKEKKRPRDRLLRDRDLASKVLELRKRGAFLGYTYRRIRTGKVDLGKAAVSGISGAVVAGSPGKRNGWHRMRLSIH